MRQLVDLGGGGPRQERPHRFLGPDGKLHRPGCLLGGKLAFHRSPPPDQKLVVEFLALQFQNVDFRIKAMTAVIKDAKLLGRFLEFRHLGGDIGIVRDGGLRMLRGLQVAHDPAQVFEELPCFRTQFARHAVAKTVKLAACNVREEKALSDVVFGASAR